MLTPFEEFMGLSGRIANLESELSILKERLKPLKEDFNRYAYLIHNPNADSYYVDLRKADFSTLYRILNENKESPKTWALCLRLLYEKYGEELECLLSKEVEQEEEGYYEVERDPYEEDYYRQERKNKEVWFNDKKVIEEPPSDYKERLRGSSTKNLLLAMREALKAEDEQSYVWVMLELQERVVVDDVYEGDLHEGVGEEEYDEENYSHYCFNNFAHIIWREWQPSEVDILFNNTAKLYFSIESLDKEEISFIDKLHSLPEAEMFKDVIGHTVIIEPDGECDPAETENTEHPWQIFNVYILTDYEGNGYKLRGGDSLYLKTELKSDIKEDGTIWYWHPNKYNGAKLRVEQGSTTEIYSAL